MSFKNFWQWCKRHVLLVGVAGIGLIIMFSFLNIEILHMTSEPEFCATCHPKQGVGPLAEVDSWEHSGHAAAGVSCLDCHGRPGPLGYMKAKLGGLKDLYMQFTISKEHKLEILANPDADLVPDEQCLFCHSDAGNREYRESYPGPLEIIEMRLVDSVENPEFRRRKGLPDILTDDFVGGINFDHAMHIEAFDQSCRDCHFGVVHNPASKTERMNYCVDCHSGFEGSAAPLIENCKACHGAQVDMNEGEGARGVSGEPSMMYGIGISCTMCHTGVEEGVYRPSSSTCTDCHEQGYEEVFINWRGEVRQTLQDIDVLRAETENALTTAEDQGREVGELWKTYRKALYNFNFIRDDGTKGIHNIDYTRKILGEVENDLHDIQSQLRRKW